MITTQQSNHYRLLVARKVLARESLTPQVEQAAINELELVEGRTFSQEHVAELRASTAPWRSATTPSTQQRQARAFLDRLCSAAGLSAHAYRQQLGEGLASAIEGACASPPVELSTRCEPLTTLSCVAHAGVFTKRTTTALSRDPLVLIFGGIEKSTPHEPTHLWLRNRSDLSGRGPVLLPADTSLAKDGNYHLMFDDERMRQLGVRPGDVIEVFQTKGEGEAKRSSVPVQVKVNDGRPGDLIIPQLPPGEIVGQVEVTTTLRRVPDRHAAGVRPDQLTVCFDRGKVKVGSKGLALEPFAKVQLTHLLSGATSEVVEVDGDGQFEVSLAAKHGEPILLRAVDHSHGLGNAAYARHLTFNAGETRALLATSPQVAGSPLTPVIPELQAGRVKIDFASRSLEIDAGTTPGSVVTLTRTGHPADTVTAIADECGTVALKLPFAPHAADVFDVRVSNPFAVPNTTEEWSGRASAGAVSHATFEIMKDGSLRLVETSGRATAAKHPVRATDNVDHVGELRDTRLELQGRIGDLELIASRTHPRTGNQVSFALEIARPQEYATTLEVDAASRELVVTLSPQQGDMRARPRLGSNGGELGTLASRAAHALAGETTLKVRFQTEEGELIARGVLDATIQTSGSSAHITTMKLNPASLSYV